MASDILYEQLKVLGVGLVYSIPAQFSPILCVSLYVDQVVAGGRWYGVFEPYLTWQEAQDFCMEKLGYLAELDWITGEDRIVPEFVSDMFTEAEPGKWSEKN